MANKDLFNEMKEYWLKMTSGKTDEDHVNIYEYGEYDPYDCDSDMVKLIQPLVDNYEQLSDIGNESYVGLCIGFMYMEAKDHKRINIGWEYRHVYLAGKILFANVDEIKRSDFAALLIIALWNHTDTLSFKFDEDEQYDDEMEKNFYRDLSWWVERSSAGIMLKKVVDRGFEITDEDLPVLLLGDRTDVVQKLEYELEYLGGLFISYENNCIDTYANMTGSTYQPMLAEVVF